MTAAAAPNSAGRSVVLGKCIQVTFTYDIHKIVGFMDPLPPCHCQIHSTYQYYHHVLDNPLPPSVRRRVMKRQLQYDKLIIACNRGCVK